jgi:hypothetical protein
MPFTGSDNVTMRLVQEIFAKPESVKQGARLPERPRVRRDAYQSTQCKRRNPEPRIAGNHPIEPRFANVVMRRITAEGVNQALASAKII